MTSRHNITSGKVYKEVIHRERRGDYLGKTVQTVPHMTDLVQTWLNEVSRIPVDGTGQVPDVCLIEVGGTVGDIESMVFLEALRQFQFTIGRENILFVHVSLVPMVGGDCEQKSKPTQHSVKELRALGLSPDLIVCRSAVALGTSTKSKISTFCQVPPSHIISVYDVSNIYHVPLILTQQALPSILQASLGLAMGPTDLQAWETMAKTVDSMTSSVQVAIVGKYVGNADAYLSLLKALKHSSIHLGVDITICWIDSADLTVPNHSAWDVLKAAKGVVIAGGFGVRGVEGKVAAVQYCRTHAIPCLGICLGMQTMVIEYARNVLSLQGANSNEFDEMAPHPVVIFMPEISTTVMGGTMRLGARSTVIEPKTLAARIYGRADAVEAFEIMERHRHRYEINPLYIQQLTDAGLQFSAKGENGLRMVCAELPEHPFFFGTQYHPEFKSRPGRPSPPFFAFAAVVCGMKERMHEAGDLWKAHEERVKQEVAANTSPKKRTERVDSTPTAMASPAAAMDAAAISSPVAKSRRFY